MLVSSGKEKVEAVLIRAREASYLASVMQSPLDDLSQTNEDKDEGTHDRRIGF